MSSGYSFLTPDDGNWFLYRVHHSVGCQVIAGEPSFTLGDVNGTAANLKHGLGFVLFVKAGILGMLEGYTYDEEWPIRHQPIEISLLNREW
jgi:hypothetical protein